MRFKDYHLHDELPEGFYKEYYKNGNLRSHGLVKNGQHTGLWELYYENGNIDQRGVYSNEKRIGVWEMHRESGGLVLLTCEGLGYENIWLIKNFTKQDLEISSYKIQLDESYLNFIN